MTYTVTGKAIQPSHSTIQNMKNHVRTLHLTLFTLLLTLASAPLAQATITSTCTTESNTWKTDFDTTTDFSCGSIFHHTEAKDKSVKTISPTKDNWTESSSYTETQSGCACGSDFSHTSTYAAELVYDGTSGVSVPMYSDTLGPNNSLDISPMDTSITYHGPLTTTVNDSSSDGPSQTTVFCTADYRMDDYIIACRGHDERTDDAGDSSTNPSFQTHNVYSFDASIVWGAVCTSYNAYLSFHQSGFSVYGNPVSCYDPNYYNDVTLSQGDGCHLPAPMYAPLTRTALYYMNW
jgi:hypothetical protein